jgi:hypothetical protein
MHERVTSAYRQRRVQEWSITARHSSGSLRRHGELELYKMFWNNEPRQL